MASGFGYRTDPFTKARKMHEGMDFTAKIGTQFMQLATVS
jgi:murein DD-endopeptidase MepM/ murein hydrolase activator NlpD